jgi:hypothetical protein
LVGKLWDGLAGKLTERWLTQSIPALFFWLVVYGTWFLTNGGWRATDELANRFTELPASAKYVTIAVVLGVVTGSIALVSRLTLPVLRLLEGYWPGWFTKLWTATRKVFRRPGPAARQKDLTVEYMVLAKKQENSESAISERRRLAAVRRRLKQFPAEPDDVMPTRVGNVLRAMEEHANSRYGLDAIVVWPHLWLTLPSDARSDITAARAPLDRSVAAIIWGTGLWPLVVLTPWAALPAVLVPVLVYRFWTVPSSVTYADLVRAAFDVYRLNVYEAFRLPVPADPGEEQMLGRQLTRFVISGRTPDLEET